MNKHTTRFALASTSLIAAAALVACGGGGGGDTAPPPVQLGSLSAKLTDAPACGFDAVNVTVSKVRVHKSASATDTEGGWTDITLAPSRKINLLNLTNGVLEELGSTPLAVGTYQQVRLVLDPNTGNGMANSVVPTGGTEQSLETPSAVQSGLKMNANVEVLANQQADLVIDFDACKSVVTRGNGKYALKPVVKVIPTFLNGITGFVSTAQLASNVVVSAQQNGQIISATVPNATTGAFSLSRLVPGNYDVVFTADGSAASVVGAVPVASTTTVVPISTAAAPIALTSSMTGSISGTVVMSPASTTEAAYVAAKQTFAAGPSVTIRYAGADLLTGAYTITKLPVAAPNYATYSATLPLVFAAATTTTPGTGKYAVSASANGYTTQTLATPVDIAVTNAINVNFTLTP